MRYPCVSAKSFYNPQRQGGNTISYPYRSQLPYEDEGSIDEYLINFFVCLADGFGALDLKEKSAKDYINYGNRIKRYDG